MKRDVASGLLLIAGSLAGLVVMSLHPTGHELMTAESFEQQARLNALVHGAAIASAPILFLGLLGLTRRLWPSELALAALVAQGFGGAAVISAAVASGFGASEVMGSLLAAGDAGRELHHALLAYNFALNQGFAAVHVVATSAAILLWSAAILRSARLARAVAFFGVLVGAGVLLLFLAGHLRLDVHGFGLVVLAQSAWLIWVGILLCRAGTRERVESG